MKISTDLHIHTLASGHAYNTIDECAKRANDIGLECIGISDHGPSMEGAPHLGYFEVFTRLPKVNNNVKMLYGCEANVIDLDGTIDITDNVCDLLDYVMAGLHARTPYEYRCYSDNTKALLNAIKDPRVNIISHPYRAEFPVDIHNIVHCAKENNTILEINKSVYIFAIQENDKDTIQKLLQMNELIIKTGALCIFGSDAHYKLEMGINQEEQKLLDDCYDLSKMNFCNNNISDYLKRRR